METSYYSTIRCFWKVPKISIRQLEINPLYCVSLLVHTSHYRFRSTNTLLKFFQNQQVFPSIERKSRGETSVVKGERYFKNDRSKNMMHIHAN